MTRKVWLLAVWCVLSLARIGAAAPVPFDPEQERAYMQRRLEMIGSALPDTPDADSGLLRLRHLALEAGLKGVECWVRTPVETADDAYVPVDLSGRGSYLQAYAFFDRVARLSRVVTVETVTLTRASDGQLRVAALLGMHYWPKAAQPPAGSVADELARAQELWAAKTNACARLFAQMANPLRLLAAFDGTRTTLAEVVLGQEFHLRGTRALPGPALLEELKRLGAEVTHSDLTSEGSCESFDVRGRVVPVSLTAYRSAVKADPVDRMSLFEPGPLPCQREAAGKSTLTLGDGTRISIELMHSTGEASPDLVSKNVLTGSGLQCRVLADRRRGYFGYTVQADALGGGRFRLTVGPIPKETRGRLDADFGRPLGEPVAIQYPAPRVVTEGEPLTLDLMVNRTTGARLYDVIRVGAARRGPSGGAPAK